MASKQQRSSHVGTQAALSFEHCLSRYLGDATLDQHDRALLQRWLEDGRANEVWDTIRAHSERHHGTTVHPRTPIAFAKFILHAKRVAMLENEILREKDVERWKTWFIKTIETLSDDMLFPFLEAVIERHRPVHSFLKSQSRIRSDHNGSRARTIFIRMVSTEVGELTGRKLYKEIAVITEIAFNIADIDVETVSYACRRRQALP